MNTTFLILIAVIVLAVALGGVIAFLYVRARQSEEVSTAAPPKDQENVLRQKEEQVTKIRQRIEELYKQQQQEQRVQHAQLSQQVDDVKLHVETNERKVDGLRGELHHEIERRDQELDELRHQLAGALDAFWKTHDALPEGQSAGPKQLAASNEAPAPTPAPSTPASATPPPTAPTPTASSPAASSPTAPPAPSALANSDFASDGDFASGSGASGDGASADQDGLQWQSFDFAADEAETHEPAPSGDSASTPLPTFASFDSFDFAAETPSPGPAPEPPAANATTAPNPEPEPEPGPELEPPAPVRPPNADTLTVISGIDDDLEQQLYGLDVTKLDQIARWSRTEARRVAQELGIKPQVVMDQWVFEAQSVLFDQYQRQLA